MLGLFQPKATISDEEFQHSFRWLTRQAVLSITSGTVTSGGLLVAYALALGATNVDIGLLAAIPFIFTVFQLPTVLLVERYRKRKLIALTAWFSARLLWLPIALIPLWLAVPSVKAVDVMMGLIALSAILIAITNTAWSSWMKDLVPTRLLGVFYSSRLSMGTLAAALFSLVAALFVDRWSSLAPGQPAVNAYAIVMGVAAFLGVLGALAALPAAEPAMVRPAGPTPPIGKSLLAPYRDRSYRTLIVFLVLWGFAVNLATPFFAVQMLTKLRLAVTSVILLTILSQMVNVLFLRVWGPLADRFGNKAVLSITGSLYVAVIFGWTFTALPERFVLTIPILVVLHILGGIATAGVTVSTIAIALKMAPAEKSTSYLAGSALATSLGSGLAPVIGGFMADYFADRELSLTLAWRSPTGGFTLPAFSIAGFDFLFFVAFIVGLLAMNALALVVERGEGKREQVLEEMIGQAQDTLRGITTMPGLRAVTHYPYIYLKHVPGLRSVVSLTERQLTDLMRESVGAAVRGVDIASGVMRAVTQVLGKVLSETPVRSHDARQVAVQSVHSAVVAVVERGGDVASGSRIAVSSTFSVLARTKAAPHDLFWAGGFGAVQGAHEAGADLALAARGAVTGARDAALLAGLDEHAAADSATTGALEAVTQLASDQRDAVRKALEVGDSYGESAPPEV